ncbi:hypothetical protein HXX76_003097 [Chlamydomonas incerta]|uniref:Uncharacterized protein n=1 Tax=Chlamydomonas incerta TaxID=51695 RepID=A0A835W6Q5_CHLIN|nr:hypothetical protein HXX76_003097 [Chlamydomonas incerta]|eukprot:KAG2441475.1 hypothetical protein HXX76_003097 [Chlamydomonas incerta]
MSSQQQRSTTSFWGSGGDPGAAGAAPPPAAMHAPPPAERSRPAAGAAPRAAAAQQPGPPPCPVKSLTQFGAMARDVLVGNKAEGLFGAPGAAKLSISSATSAGVSLTTTATCNTAAAAAKPAAGQLLAAYAAPGAAWQGDVLLTSGGVAELTVTRGFTLPASLYTSDRVERDRDREGGEAGGGGRPTAPTPAPLRPPLKPGWLVVGGVVSLPGLSSREQVLPPKLTLEYGGTYCHGKLSSTPLPALAPGGGPGRPAVTASAVAGAGRVALGADVSFSLAGSSGSSGGGAATAGAGGGRGGGGAAVRLDRWSAAAAWHDEKQHVALQLLQNGKTASLLYGYSLQPGVTLGVSAEADVSGVRLATAGSSSSSSSTGGEVPAAAAAEGAAAGRSKTGGGGFLPPPTFAVGASFRLPAAAASSTSSSSSSRYGNNSGGNKSSGSANGGGGGGVVKVKAASDGTVSLLYRDVTSTGQRLTLTAQLDALHLTKSPRLGMSVDV